MTVREWIREQEIRGKTMFSFDTLKKAFPSLNAQVILNNLTRLKSEKVIYSPYSSFYVTLPPQYVLRGTISPYYFMGTLMANMERHHYFGLLSAAVLWGAAHQRPQTDFVVTTPPKLSTCRASKNLIKWIYKESIPSDLLCEKAGEAGPVTYSNAELTALDLVQFEQHAGGLSVVATILSELLEHADFPGAADSSFKYCKKTTIQRLGYIVECVLGDVKQGQIIFTELSKYNQNLRYVALSPRGKQQGVRNERWKLIINVQIEVDEI